MRRGAPRASATILPALPQSFFEPHTSLRPPPQGVYNELFTNTPWRDYRKPQAPPSTEAP